jgi:hypothetical protein
MSGKTTARSILVWLCFAVTLCGCTYRPARFADRPAVTEVADDAPIAQPKRRELDWDWYLSDAYLRRAVLHALDPKRPVDAGDINALDEVPRSSWFQPPGPTLALLDPPLTEDGPPIPPLTLVPDVPRANDDGVCVVDGRGLRYELRRDRSDRPEMRTSAAAIASRLIRAFGLLTPEVHIVFLGSTDFVSSGEGGEPPEPIRRLLHSGPPSVDGRYRASATRWPVGIDVGVSESYDVRSDDPNDAIPHRNRRTLRSLKVLGAWLAISSINPRKTRDAYVGTPWSGHIRHYLVGLEDALGAGSVVDRQKARGLRTDLGGGMGFNLVTFGLWPGSDSLPTQRRMLALGNIDEKVDAAGFKASPPYGPISFFQDADGYWAAKRIAAIPLATIIDAVESAHIHDSSARLALVRLIVARRQAVVAHWYAQVSPVEVERVRDRIVVLRDESVSRAVSDVARTRYHVTILDEDGSALSATLVLELHASEFAIVIPEELLADRDRDRLVVRLHAEVNRKKRPRACYVHLRPLPGTVRVVGIRH